MDMTLGVQIQTILTGRFTNSTSQLLHIGRSRQTQCNVFRDSQGVKQGKMLEHHTDAQLSGRRRTADLDGLAVPQNLALIGFDHTVDDLHQGGFTRAILPQHGMNLPRQDREGNIVVGYHRRIGLGDIAKFQAWHSLGVYGYRLLTGLRRMAHGRR